MLGHDFSIPQPVILNQLGAMMQELQHRQQAMSQATPSKLQKPHEVLDLALNAIANMGHGLEAEVNHLLHGTGTRQHACPSAPGISIFVPARV